jgi:hypothetical protein
MVSLGDPACMNYLRNLSTTQKEYFTLPWGAVVLMDCSDNGDLLTFKSVSDFKELDKEKTNGYS